MTAPTHTEQAFPGLRSVTRPMNPARRDTTVPASGVHICCHYGANQRVARARAERQGNHSKAARCIACTLLRWVILTVVSVLLGAAVALAVGWAVVWFVVVGLVRVIVGVGV